jgi:hypothetical protein
VRDELKAVHELLGPGPVAFQHKGKHPANQKRSPQGTCAKDQEKCAR